MMHLVILENTRMTPYLYETMKSRPTMRFCSMGEIITTFTETLTINPEA